MTTWIAKRVNAVGAVIVTAALVCPVACAQTYNIIRLDGLGGGAAEGRR